VPIRRVALIRPTVLLLQPEGRRLRAGGWPLARRRQPLRGPARRLAGPWPGGTEARHRPAGRPVRRQMALRPDEEARIQQVQREVLTQQEMQVLRAVLLQP